MCTEENKLRRASDQVLIKRNQERAELIHLRKGFAQAIEATKAAESESKRCADRCMRLTKNADISNALAYISLIFAFVFLGFVVYGL